jgi:hypothetical protein
VTSGIDTAEPAEERAGERDSATLPSPTWVFWGWLGALAASLALWTLLVVAVVR